MSVDEKTNTPTVEIIDSESSEDIVPATIKESTFSKQRKLKNLENIKRLEILVEENPWDILSWQELLARVQQKFGKSKPEDVRNCYEKFLQIYPTNGKVFLKYINFELSKNDNNEKVEELYHRVLNDCYDIEIWKNYIQYVRKQNDLITGGQEARNNVNQSYEFAIRNIGFDIESGVLFDDYLKFIDEWNPISKWEEQQKTDLKRKALKQAVTTPNHNIEEFWMLFTNFEDAVNKATARKHISDLSPQYMLARSWYKEFVNLTKILISLDKKRNNEKLSITVQKIWINLEKQNKLRISNRRLLNKRIEFSYQKTLDKFPYYTEIWFEYANFKLSENIETPINLPAIISDTTIKNENYSAPINPFGNYRSDNLDTGIKILKQSLSYNPMSTVLSYLLAELYELKNDHDAILKTFDDLLNVLINNYEQLEVDENYITQQLSKPLKSDLEKWLDRKLHPKEDIEEYDEDDEDVQEVQETQDIIDTRKKILDPSLHLNDEQKNYYLNIKKNIEQNKLKLERLVTSVYVNYIKFTKRAIKKNTSRTIFKDARKKFKNLTWHIYFEEAMFEYTTSSNTQAGTKIALKIFDIGMKNLDLKNYRNFPFLVEYFKFLILVNDYNNIKSLFEVCVKTLLPKKSDSNLVYFNNNNNSQQSQTEAVEDKEIIAQRNKALQTLFQLFLRYELYNGNILTIQNLQNRYKEIFPDESSFYIFSEIYREYNGLNLLKDFEIDVNSNKLMKSLHNYDEEIGEKILYKDLPNEKNNYQIDLLHNKSVDDVLKKLNDDHLLEHYGLTNNINPNIIEYSEFDLLNYGLKDQSEAYKLASIVKDISPFNNLKRSREDVEAEDKPLFQEEDDDYNPLNIIVDQKNDKSENNFKFDGENSVVDDNKPFVSDNIYNILRVLPSANTFGERLFDPNKVVNMLRNLDV